MSIALNRQAARNYHLDDRFEAGMALQGWEVKSILAGRAQLAEARVVISRGEAYLLNCSITPLPQADKSLKPQPDRSRKLLLHAAELRKLIGKVRRAGYTLVPVSIYRKSRRLKLEFALGRGKKKHDKRETLKKREWEREKSRAFAVRGRGRKPRD